MPDWNHQEASRAFPGVLAVLGDDVEVARGRQ